MAFQGSSTPTNPFSVPIDAAYLTSNFKMRFYFNFNSTSEYVYVDNIEIKAQPETEADTSVAFRIAKRAPCWTAFAQSMLVCHLDTSIPCIIAHPFFSL